MQTFFQLFFCGTFLLFFSGTVIWHSASAVFIWLIKCQDKNQVCLVQSPSLTCIKHYFLSSSNLCRSFLTDHSSAWVFLQSHLLVLQKHGDPDTAAGGAWTKLSANATTSLCFSCSHWKKILKKHQKAVQHYREDASIKQIPRQHKRKLLPSMCTGRGILLPLWCREGSKGLPALFLSWSCCWQGALLCSLSQNHRISWVERDPEGREAGLETGDGDMALMWNLGPLKESNILFSMPLVIHV